MPVKRRVDLVGDARRQHADRRHLLGQLQLFDQPYPVGDVLDQQDRARRHRGVGLVRSALERDRGDVDEQPRGIVLTSGERHTEERRAARVLPPLGAQRLDERRLEHVGQQSIDGVNPGHAVEGLERAIPADDPLGAVEHDQAVLERFEDVLVELAQAVELFGLQMQLPIEPAVLDRGRGLSCDRCQQCQVFAVERLFRVLPAQRQNGNRAPLEYARHEVVDAGVPPELDLFGHEPGGDNRIVQRHRVAGVQPRNQRGASRQARRTRARTRNR